MTRTHRVLWGAATGYTVQAVMAVGNLWLIQFLIDRLGDARYGLWAVIAQTLAYLTLLDLGVMALLPRETAQAEGMDEFPAPSTPSVVSRAARLVLWQWPLVALFATGVWFLFPDRWEAARGALTWVLLGFVVVFPLRLFDHVLRGLQDFAWLGRLTLLSWLVNLAVTVVAVLGGLGLESLAFGWIAGQLTIPLLSVRRLLRKRPEVLPGDFHLRSETLEKDLDWIRRGLWASLQQVANLFLTASDVLILGWFLGPEAVVPYVVTAKLPLLLAHQPALLAELGQPGLAELRAQGDPVAIRRAVQALTEVVLYLSIGIVSLVLAVNRGFVQLWVGEQYWGGMILTGLLVIRVFFSHWSLMAATGVFAFRHDRWLGWVGFATGVVALAGSLLLTPILGWWGPPIGYALGQGLVAIPLNLTLLGRELGGSGWGLLRSMVPVAWRLIVLALAGLGLAHLLVERVALSTTILAALAVGIIYLAVIFPRLLSPALRPYLPSFLAARLPAAR